ncbi:alpha/beta hydrolase [Nisaea acidiphila]|uniref:Alpha/beta hydrolase n=1 Tax=Nisaea acidiphila TaxID=1862145 RepID=A0A9J7AWP0_9PROT|nr:alpha/beta hydrolase [Nisaea acidiphila]UUX50668.1 alpha/beta hydrolase [Nisaea acidiphila]
MTGKLNERAALWSGGERSGRISAGGRELEAIAHGPAPGSGPTLILLHEGLGCVALWRGFPEALSTATGCGVFAYSRAGYGASEPCDLPRPLNYMTREAVDVLPEVLAASGANEIVLIGHSDGASIAALHCGIVRDPRVRGLVLMAPHFFTEEMGLKSIAEARTAYAETDLRGRLAKYHHNVDAAFRGWNDAWLDPGFESWDIRSCLDRIEVPILCLQGAEDQYGTEAQVRIVADRVEGLVETVLIPDCRHAPHLEAPEITVRKIAGFIAALARDGGKDGE